MQGRIRKQKWLARLERCVREETGLGDGFKFDPDAGSLVQSAVR